MDGRAAFTQPGDPRRAGEAMIRVVESDEPPLRLLLGNPAADLAPNSTVEVPGVAKVTVHKQSKTEDTLSVTMLHVELLAPRGDLPKGAVVEVGHSTSRLK